MKAAAFDYVATTDVQATCDLLSEAGGGATILAGGQTLMPLLALRMSQPFIVVDINGVEALRGVTRSDSGTRIGPITRQNDIIADEQLARSLPALVTATRHVGHHQTRNRGTIGGSIAFGEPAAELPATAAALGATIEARSVRGVRQIAARDLYLGPYMTTLEPDELVTSIHFPDWPPGSRTIFRELARRPGDFALIGLVGSIVVEHGKIERAGLAWFGMGPTPICARRAEGALIGQTVQELDVRGVAELAVSDTDPFDDHHATARYRRTVGRRVFAQALAEGLGLEVRS